MTTRENRRRRHKRHKREAAARARNRITRRRCRLPITDDPVTMTELLYMDDTNRARASSALILDLIVPLMQPNPILDDLALIPTDQ